MANKPLEGCCLKLTSTGFYEMSKVCCVLRRFSLIGFISAASVITLLRQGQRTGAAVFSLSQAASGSL